MKLLLFIILTLFFVSCNSQQSESPSPNLEKGRLTGNTYFNDYFGFQLRIDTPWHILNENELSQLMNERSNMLNKDTNNKFAIANGVEILLSLAMDTIKTMPHVLISLLEIKMFPQIKNEKDYLENYLRQVNKMYEGYDVKITSTEIKQEKLNSRTFFTTLITIEADNFHAIQKRYSLKIKDKLLNLMTNYDSDFYQDKCMHILNNIKWK